MLLYMDAHRGKRHYSEPVSDESSSPKAQSGSDNQSFTAPNEKALETRQVSSANPAKKA